MVIGFARMHTRDRDLRNQRAALCRARCDTIIEVSGRGAAAHREGLARLMAALGRGDTLVVRELDRLTNSLTHLMELSALLQERSVTLRVLVDDPESIGGGDASIGQVVAALAAYRRTIKGG